MKTKKILFIALALASISCQGKSVATASENDCNVVAEDAKIAVVTPQNDNEYRPGMQVKTPVIIDFNATWCGPCRLFAPSFDKAAEAFKGKVKFVSIDVDQYPMTANEYRIQSIPTIIMLMPDGYSKKYIGLNEFISGLDPNGNPSEEEINDAIYNNLCSEINTVLKR